MINTPWPGEQDDQLVHALNLLLRTTSSIMAGQSSHRCDMEHHFSAIRRRYRNYQATRQPGRKAFKSSRPNVRP